MTAPEFRHQLFQHFNPSNPLDVRRVESDASHLSYATNARVLVTFLDGVVLGHCAWSTFEWDETTLAIWPGKRIDRSMSPLALFWTPEARAQYARAVESLHSKARTSP